MGNPAVWRAVMGQDADILRETFAELLGSRYRLSGGAGLVRDALSADPSTYTRVRDLEAAVAFAERLGGRVLVPITDSGDARIAVLSGVDGRPVGLCSGGAG